MRSFQKLLLVVFAAVLGALAVVVLFHLTSWGKDAGPIINIENTPINRDTKPATSFAPIVKKAGPSVVNIYSTRIVQERFRRYFNDPFVRQFFGDQIPDDERGRTQKELGFGSGVIVAPDGYILTANHVVAGMDEIKVAIANDKKEYTAKIIGTDPETDVAVLKIDAKDLPAITLGDSDQLEVGDIVLAIGNPFGIARQAGQTTSVTMGIISALGRNNVDFGGQPKVQFPIQDFIQTDATINPGNSGGALVDAEGRLVGINTGIETSSRGNEGIGFAVPINMARHVMERIIGGGKVTRAFIGVALQNLDAGLANYFSLPDQNGALVDDVTPGSSAAKAGIQSGDVIVAFNGKDITDANNLILAVSDCLPGSAATLKMIRNGSVKTVNVTLGEKVEQVTQNENVQNTPKMDTSIKVSDIDRDARQELRIPNAIQGALVMEVAQGSSSAAAGLQRFDIIEEINRQPVNSAEEAIKLCKQAKGDWIFLKIWQHGGALGNTRYLSVDNKK